jgi:DNA polymerase III delta subunit
MIVVHGDNTIASRNYLQQKKAELKAQGIGEIVTLEGKKMAIEAVVGALEAQSLFGNEKYIIIEDFLSRPKSVAKNEIEDYLQKTNPGNCLLWEGKKATPTQLKKFAKATIQECKSSSQTFQFLDSLGTTRENSVRLFQKALETDAEGSLFFMMVRQVRLLLLAGASTYQIPPWQKQKLTKQAGQLGEKRLLMLHRELLEIDQKNKTSGSLLGLTGELEVLLAKLYDQKV